jgi:hypothetical protein
LVRNLPALLALCAVLLLAVPAQAQILNAQVGGFGTQVKLGDADYLPVLKRVSLAVRAVEADFGIAGEVQDNCIVILNEFPSTDLPGGVFRAPKAAGAAWPLQTKDIMASPCQGKAPGTLVSDLDAVMKTFPWTERIVDVRYADLNNNGRFDKGDAAYLMAVGAAPLLAATANGLVPSTATGVWTLRLTPNGPYAAGTFVKAEDSDIQVYGTLAAGSGTTTLATPKQLKAALEEREGGSYYIIPEAPAGSDATGASAGLAAGTPYQFKQQNVPANSIRIGTASSFTLQPNVMPSAVALTSPDDAQAGVPLNILVTVTNSGADAGQGVLMTRLDGRVVDVRMTPKLSPGEVTKILVTLPGPLRGGVQQLEVNDVVSAISIKGAAGASAASATGSGDLAALQSQLAELQAKVAALQAGGSVVKTQGAPGMAPLALLASLVLVAFAVRRRSEE